MRRLLLGLLVGGAVYVASVLALRLVIGANSDGWAVAYMFYGAICGCAGVLWAARHA
jgi:hypothetical protein